MRKIANKLTELKYGKIEKRGGLGSDGAYKVAKKAYNRAIRHNWRELLEEF